jgi:Eukaryotic aspartyl protease
MCESRPLQLSNLFISKLSYKPKGNHTFLGPSTSSSFVATNNTFNITYGLGAVNGTIVMDNIKIAGLSLTNHTFGVANQESENFASSSYDGLMGLASSVCTRF